MMRMGRAFPWDWSRRNPRAPGSRTKWRELGRKRRVLGGEWRELGRKRRVFGGEWRVGQDVEGARKGGGVPKGAE
jgi:hypothetical protein